MNVFTGKKTVDLEHIQQGSHIFSISQTSNIPKSHIPVPSTISYISQLVISILTTEVDLLMVFSSLPSSVS